VIRTVRVRAVWRQRCEDQVEQGIGSVVPDPEPAQLPVESANLGEELLAVLGERRQNDGGDVRGRGASDAEHGRVLDGDRGVPKLSAGGMPTAWSAVIVAVGSGTLATRAGLGVVESEVVPAELGWVGRAARFLA
jgi:hypothetical protein